MATSTSIRFQWNQGIAVQLEAAIEQGLEETAAAMKPQMVALCPVGRDHTDGSTHLYQEIDVTVQGGRDHREIVAVADKDYAVHVIFGTSRIKGRDFIRPVIDAEGPRITGRIKAALGGIR